MHAVCGMQYYDGWLGTRLAWERFFLSSPDLTHFYLHLVLDIFVLASRRGKMAISASGVPDGMYFGGGESEEEDGGFVFGDSPPAAQSHWGFVAEPTVAAVTKKVPPGAAMENGGTSSSEEGEVNGVCGGTNGKLRYEFQIVPPPAGGYIVTSQLVRSYGNL